MVKKYHHWMLSPELLGIQLISLFNIVELTASEPLSLEEEYENQVSWLADTTSKIFNYYF